MSAPFLEPCTASRSPAIETRGLVKRFGSGAPALNGLDLRVPSGAVYVLAGPNGAGKTTTMRVLLDLVRADAGTATVQGVDTTSDPAVARAQIGYVPEVVDTAYTRLTVRKLLLHRSAFFRSWDHGYVQALCNRFAVRMDERWQNLSKGSARVVALVAALAHRPPVLLLDEPTDGLDPLAREDLFELLVEHMSESPTTVLWSTHHVHEAERLADYLGVLRDGRLLLQAPVDRVRSRIRRYRAEVPEGWAGLNGQVLVVARAGREVTLTAWGEELEVVERLEASGATVRAADRLSLEDATFALLRSGRNP